MKTILWNRMVLGFLLLGNDAFGYLYYVCVMKKLLNKQTNQEQFVIGLGDYHDKKNPANKTHRIYLESLLKKCSAGRGKLIVEDLSSINSDGRMTCCNYGVNCSQGVLGQLANKARECGVDVDNVEYRYCRVAGIAPLINNLHADPHVFKSSAALTIALLYKEVADEIEKIKKYDDGKILNALYKRTITAVHNALLKMRLQQNCTDTIADYCSQLKTANYRQELEKLCIFDTGLVDMNIVHSIIACNSAPFIFVVAGGSHIEEVSTILRRVGYESIFTTCVLSAALSPAIKKVLDSADCGSGASDARPEPVDITIIDKFVR